MTCQKCGSPCHGRLCEMCEMIQLNEKMHGESVDDHDPWNIEDGDRDD